MVQVWAVKPNTRSNVYVLSEFLWYYLFYGTLRILYTYSICLYLLIFATHMG